MIYLDSFSAVLPYRRVKAIEIHVPVLTGMQFWHCVALDRVLRLQRRDKILTFFHFFFGGGRFMVCFFQKVSPGFVPILIVKKVVSFCITVPYNLFSSGGRTRTYGLRVMSPTSYQLLHSAMYVLPRGVIVSELDCKSRAYFSIMQILFHLFCK